jgi:hypothetical protein
MLAACGATQAQMKGNHIRTEAQSASADYSACRAAVLSRPEYNAFSDRIILKGQATQAQMADARVVPADERELTASLFDELGRCREPYVSRYGAAAPGTIEPMRIGWQQADLSRARLVNGDVTWGVHQQELSAVEMATRANLQGAVAALDQQLNAEHASEMQSRAIVAGAFGAAMGVAAGAAVAPRPYVYAPTYVVRPRRW